MKPIARSLCSMVAGLVLLLHSTPSSGQGVNATVSDSNLNTAGGSGALLNTFNIMGSGAGFNTAFGRDALRFNTTGDFNTASGSSTLFSNTTGVNNTASGASALGSNTAGANNTASGVSALAFNTTGNNNTASGGFALEGNIAGNNNTAAGFKALQQSTGTKNIGIGYQAGVTLQTGSNNIYIGNQGNGDESQTIRIGTAQGQTFIAGIAGVNVSNAEVVAVDATTGQLGIVQLSSARYKQDITPMGSRSEGVLQLRPVTFGYKDDAKGTVHYGLVAEEVAAVYPQLVTYAPTGEVRTVKYQELIPMLLNELQRQQRELAELRSLVGSRQGQ